MLAREATHGRVKHENPARVKEAHHISHEGADFTWYGIAHETRYQDPVRRTKTELQPLEVFSGVQVSKVAVLTPSLVAILDRKQRLVRRNLYNEFVMMADLALHWRVREKFFTKC